jgi:hypothetical protein
MATVEQWQNFAKHKVDEILKDVGDICPIKAPILIKEVIELYLGDVHFVGRMGGGDFPKGVSAFSKKDMNLGWIIVLNEEETVERQRFSAAHELAHIVLFKNQSNKVFCSHDSCGPEEKLCDRFAGDILMPENMIRRMYETNPKPFIGDIAKSFKVSWPVAQIQLRRLGLPFKLNDG